MRAILIDPYLASVTEVETTATLADLYRLIGCDTICRLGLAPGLAIYLDDNGLRDQPGALFTFLGYDQPLAGRGLVIGEDGPELCGTSVPLEAITGRVVWRPGIEATGLDTITESDRGDGFHVIRVVPHFRPKDE